MGVYLLVTVWIYSGLVTALAGGNLADCISLILQLVYLRRFKLGEKNNDVQWISPL